MAIGGGRGVVLAAGAFAGAEFAGAVVVGSGLVDEDREMVAGAAGGVDLGLQRDQLPEEGVNLSGSGVEVHVVIFHDGMNGGKVGNDDDCFWAGGLPGFLLRGTETLEKGVGRS